jgi:hypothetical protein
VSGKKVRRDLEWARNNDCVQGPREYAVAADLSPRAADLCTRTQPIDVRIGVNSAHKTHFMFHAVYGFGRAWLNLATVEICGLLGCDYSYGDSAHA